MAEPAKITDRAGGGAGSEASHGAAAARAGAGPAQATAVSATGRSRTASPRTRSAPQGGVPAPPDGPASRRARAKQAEARSEAKGAAGRRSTVRARGAKETEEIRAALVARRDELRAEYDQTLSEITELQRDRFTDSSGDDQVDVGTKTFEHEQEISLANSILNRITQVERALERLDAGGYGWCERCGDPIPVERLAAFPSATLCVSCKQLEERR